MARKDCIGPTSRSSWPGHSVVTRRNLALEREVVVKRYPPVISSTCRRSDMPWRRAVLHYDITGVIVAAALRR